MSAVKISALPALADATGVGQTDVLPGNVSSTTSAVQVKTIVRVPARALTASASFNAYDEAVFVDTTSGVVTLTLVTPVKGRQYFVQRTNATGTNKITIARAASESINGTAASYDLPSSDSAAIGRWHIICDPSGNWWVG